MKFRVMIRSLGAYKMTGNGWEQLEYWSTWQSGLTEKDAFQEKLELQRGGNRVTIIPEDRYNDFCFSHKIA